MKVLIVFSLVEPYLSLIETTLVLHPTVPVDAIFPYLSILLEAIPGITPLGTGKDLFPLEKLLIGFEFGRLNVFTGLLKRPTVLDFGGVTGLLKSPDVPDVFIPKD